MSTGEIFKLNHYRIILISFAKPARQWKIMMTEE